MPNLKYAHLSSLHRSQAQTNRDGASNRKIDFITQYKKILSLKGNQTRISGSKVIVLKIK